MKSKTKIGVIGLGDIALKAYLPLVTKADVDLHLCTRNEETLHRVGNQYRITNLYGTIDSLIEAGIQGAFVHTSTASHYEIVEKLLKHNIHVCVDKPIAYNYDSSAQLIKLAQDSNRTLMVGFNRRYAPAYQELLQLSDVNMIVYQKNRNNLPGEVRPFVFDDFIHVIDTLLFLFRRKIHRVHVCGRKIGSKLLHVMIQLIADDGCTAVGIMNRDSGTTEEKLEMFTPSEKRVVHNISDSFAYRGNNEIHVRSDDWEYTLKKRGFNQLIARFIESVKLNRVSGEDAEDNLMTHRMCEYIVQELNK